MTGQVKPENRHSWSLRLSSGTGQVILWRLTGRGENDVDRGLSSVCQVSLAHFIEKRVDRFKEVPITLFNCARRENDHCIIFALVIQEQ